MAIWISEMLCEVFRVEMAVFIEVGVERSHSTVMRVEEGSLGREERDFEVSLVTSRTRAMMVWLRRVRYKVTRPWPIPGEG